MSRDRTNTCKCHCRGCDTCFSSLKAFDLHRDNGTCLFPMDVSSKKQSLLDMKVGNCRITAKDREGIEVWSTVKTDSQSAFYASTQRAFGSAT